MFVLDIGICTCIQQYLHEEILSSFCSNVQEALAIFVLSLDAASIMPGKKGLEDAEIILQNGGHHWTMPSTVGKNRMRIISKLCIN
ncbi:hypothetical protein C8034_v011534 [Colletotrichum sidae]|uniref:Uncharacterized protein n=1 Tax=Colletotrichum sidae TaxID=1347389 RepID=A0A4R8TJ93_9PEZI|nr:hypothetical protein C8034_v011534 [Colletotrichum sidae]